jgi:hypothetical protein
VRRGPRWHAAYILKTSPGAVLVDTGPEASGASVMQGFQKARVGLRSVRAILFEVDGHIEVGDVVEERFQVVAPPGGNGEPGRLAFLFAPSGALFVGDGVVLTADRTR